AEHTIVMYAGEVVEAGPTVRILAGQRHPYTLGLLKSRPDLSMPRKSALWAVPGTVPEPGAWSAACRFAPRCERALAICGQVHPDLVREGEDRQVRCHNPVTGLEELPKLEAGTS